MSDIPKWLKTISGPNPLVIPFTDGKQKIVNANQVFDAIDHSFHKLDRKFRVEVQSETPVEILEIGGKCMTHEIIDLLGGHKSTYFTQDQIIKFAVEHRDWLLKVEYRTFMPFKAGKDFFVVSIYPLLSNPQKIGIDYQGWERPGIIEEKYRYHFVTHWLGDRQKQRLLKR